jgi:hypothetical protein
MWPMLIELLPHLSRLVPLWDTFLTSKQASDKATEAAILALSTGVRTDLDQVTEAHASLYRQLQAHTAQIEALGDELRLTRAAAERAEAAALRPDPALAVLTTWVKYGVLSIIALLAVVIILLLTHRHG